MPVLQVENASKRFDEVQALDGVSFEAEEGEILGLLGPNGSGKSTLMRSVVTLERLDAGRIRIAGTDAAADPAAARRHLGYAGQDLAIDKVLTGREFLRFQAGLVHLPRTEIAGRVDEMLQKLDLLEAADRSCEGYSGGMRRRLDLAASLMHRPKMVVLDEPSAGLDYEARRRLWDFLLGLRAEGVAVIVATHDFEEADTLCSRVLLMAAGRVAAAGSPDALRSGLGAWVISGALHEHLQEGDVERLEAVFEGLPGRLLPRDPHAPELSIAVPPEDGSDDAAVAHRWTAELEARAEKAGTPLVSLTFRRPTLQDVYRAEVGSPLAALEEAARG